MTIQTDTGEIARIDSNPPFDIILIDPPWPFEAWSEKGKARAPENHYQVMTLEDIANLRVGDLAGKNAALFLWISWPIMFDAIPMLFDEWGFTYRTRAFTWAKTTRASKRNLTRILSQLEQWKKAPSEVVRFVLKEMWHMGLGYYTRANDEICLLAVRGSMPVVTHAVRSLVVSPLTRHSEKPPEVYDRIEKLYPNHKYIELFARRARPGWVALGNEIDGQDIRDALEGILQK